jgi:hypothetical protein
VDSFKTIVMKNILLKSIKVLFVLICVAIWYTFGILVYNYTRK